MEEAGKNLRAQLEGDKREVEGKRKEMEEALGAHERAIREVESERRLRMGEIAMAMDALEKRVSERRRELEGECERISTRKGQLSFSFSSSFSLSLSRWNLVFHLQFFTLSIFETHTEKELREHEEPLKAHERMAEITRAAIERVEGGEETEMGICSRGPALHDRVSSFIKILVRSLSFSSSSSSSIFLKNNNEEEEEKKVRN